VALGLLLVGCAQPGSIRTLADETARTIVTSDAGLQAVEARRAEQRRDVAARIAVEVADSDRVAMELAEIEERWSFSPEHKDDVAQLARIRATPAAVRPVAARATAEPPAAVTRAKLDRLLKAMRGGAAWSIVDVLNFAGQTRAELKKVDDEAAAAAPK